VVEDVPQEVHGTEAIAVKTSLVNNLVITMINEKINAKLPMIPDHQLCQRLNIRLSAISIPTFHAQESQ
jgi:hypothetical protein